MGKVVDLIKNFNWTISVAVLLGLISLFLLIITSMTIVFLTNSGSITADSIKAASITFLLFSLGGIALSIGSLVVFVKYNNKILDTNLSPNSIEMQKIRSNTPSNMLFT